LAFRMIQTHLGSFSCYHLWPAIACGNCTQMNRIMTPEKQPAPHPVLSRAGAFKRATDLSAASDRS
jgi:hypothetical protein